MTNSFDEYQQTTATTAIYPGAGTGSEAALAYVGLGLGETGEVQGKIGDLLADGHSPEALAEVAAELGDVLWFIARFATELKQPLSSIAARSMYPAETGISISAFVQHVTPTGADRPTLERAALALGSAGDLQGAVSKILRGDPAAQGTQYRKKLRDQLVVLLRDVAVLSDVLGVPLADVADGNLRKLAGRAARGTIHGDGDHR